MLTKRNFVKIIGNIFWANKNNTRTIFCRNKIHLIFVQMKSLRDLEYVIIRLYKSKI